MALARSQQENWIQFYPHRREQTGKATKKSNKDNKKNRKHNLNGKIERVSVYQCQEEKTEEHDTPFQIQAITKQEEKKNSSLCPVWIRQEITEITGSVSDIKDLLITMDN